MSDTELNRLRQAIGLMTTIKPDMEVDVSDPVGMALEVVKHVEQLKRDAESWEQCAAAASENADYWREKFERVDNSGEG